jgi:hypothetical protein
MVFSATFNNISVILWPSVSLVDETRGPGENLTHIYMTTQFLGLVHALKKKVVGLN